MGKIVGTVFAMLVTLALMHDVSAFSIRMPSPGTGLFEGTVAVGRGVFIRKSRGSTKSTATIVPFVANYTPTTNLAFGINAPYVHKSLEGPGIGDESTEGLGDILLRGKYRFYKTVGLRRQTQAAFQFGVELPTGSTSRSVDQRLSPITQRNLQPGTGSYDLIFDISYLKQVNRLAAGGSLTYRHNTEDDDVKFGDQFSAKLDLEYILLPRKYPGRELVLILEAVYLHTEENEFKGRKLPSGGDEVFLAPGLQYIATENLLLEASFLFPVVQDTKGTTTSIDYNFLLGFRFLW